MSTKREDLARKEIARYNRLEAKIERTRERLEDLNRKARKAYHMAFASLPEGAMIRFGRPGAEPMTYVPPESAGPSSTPTQE